MTQGTRLAARPTAYKGIQMRSRLEARYAAWLDHWRFQWEYEPRCFASELGQYLPDFVIHDVAVLGSEAATRQDVYVEVKPTVALFQPSELLRCQEIIAATHAGAVLILETERNGMFMPCWGNVATGAWTYSDGPTISAAIPRDWGHE